MVKGNASAGIKIIERKISELKPAEYNPRELTKKQYEDLKASLSEFGMVNPLLVNMHADRKNVLIGGHQRARVWAEMGNDTIPCVEVSMELDKEKEVNVRLNKNQGHLLGFQLRNKFLLVEFADPQSRS